MSRSAVALIAEIEGCQEAPAIMDLLASFSAPFGFSALMLGHLSNPLRSPRDNNFLLHTCPPAMIDRLIASTAFLYDAVLHTMLRAGSPFSWTSIHRDTPPPAYTMLSVVREFGYADGHSFPIMGRYGTPGGASLCGDGRSLEPEAVTSLHEVLTVAFHRLETLAGPADLAAATDLSVLERATLICAAGGKSVSESATIMGIADISAKDALRRARRKLGARTTTQAVAIAMAAKIIA